jgi:glutathione peroxidase
MESVICEWSSREFMNGNPLSENMENASVLDKNAILSHDCPRFKKGHVVISRFLFLGAYLLFSVTAAQSAQDVPPSAATCPKVLQHTVARLQDEKPQNLCQYAGQVVVVVNTASFCGFTSQYKGLETLHAKYKDRGLVVLGFPSNDFSQEPESNAKIADFCENTFGVKFPMFVKTTVKGSGALPLYKQLAEQTGTTPKWNFYKYVISRDGKDIKSFSSMTGPQDKSFVQEIEKQLAMKGATP